MIRPDQDVNLYPEGTLYEQKAFARIAEYSQVLAAHDTIDAGVPTVKGLFFSDVWQLSQTRSSNTNSNDEMIPEKHNMLYPVTFIQLFDQDFYLSSISGTSPFEYVLQHAELPLQASA